MDPLLILIPDPPTIPSRWYSVGAAPLHVGPDGYQQIDVIRPTIHTILEEDNDKGVVLVEGVTDSVGTKGLGPWRKEGYRGVKYR